MEITKQIVLSLHNIFTVGTKIQNNFLWDLTSKRFAKDGFPAQDIWQFDVAKKSQSVVILQQEKSRNTADIVCTKRVHI